MSTRASVFVLVLCEVTWLAYSRGTTAHLKDVFIGRCWQYQSISEQNKISVLSTKLNCTELWLKFYDSFAYKSPCEVNVSSYSKFFEMLDNKKKIYNSLFWSGSKDLVHDFTFINDDFIVLEDTLTGYLLNDLVWCGSKTSPDGLNYDYCKESSSNCNAMYPAWYEASAKFAQRASGTAHVLLNASRAGKKNAYHPGSFFRSVEMPRLRVDKLTVLVATSIGTPVREKCGLKSLIELERDAKRQNIKPSCTDQPVLVMRVFCLKFPRANQCMTSTFMRSEEPSKENEETVLWRTICFILIALVALLLLLSGICIIQKYVFPKNNATFKYLHHKVSFSKAPILTNEDSDNNNAA